MKILLAEDEEQLNHVIKMALESVNYEVDSVYNGQEALDMAQKNAYDVFIFDIMMPVMDGITALKKLRESGNKNYVMMLTAKSEIDDRVTGLESGADDYLTKPFSLKELIARLRSQERRSEDYSSPVLTFSDLKLDKEKMVLSAQNSISLSNKEADLMEFLMLNPEKELTTEQIYKHLWQNDPDSSVDLVWIYISYLKQKLTSILSQAKINGENGGSFKLTK